MDPYFLDNDWTTATARDGVGCEFATPAQTTTPPSTTASDATSTTTTTTAAAPTTTVETQVQGAQQLPVTGAGGVALIAALGLALLNFGYLTASATRRSRRQRSKR